MRSCRARVIGGTHSDAQKISILHHNCYTCAGLADVTSQVHSLLDQQTRLNLGFGRVFEQTLQRGRMVAREQLVAYTKEHGDADVVYKAQGAASGKKTVPDGDCVVKAEFSSKDHADPS